MKNEGSQQIQRFSHRSPVEFSVVHFFPTIGPFGCRFGRVSKSPTSSASPKKKISESLGLKGLRLELDDQNILSSKQRFKKYDRNKKLVKMTCGHQLSSFLDLTNLEGLNLTISRKSI